MEKALLLELDKRGDARVSHALRDPDAIAADVEHRYAVETHARPLGLL